MMGTSRRVDLNTVREPLGHKSLAMTLRYAHLAPAHKAAADLADLGSGCPVAWAGRDDSRDSFSESRTSQCTAGQASDFRCRPVMVVRLPSDRSLEPECSCRKR